jgi:signal peptidase II
MARKPSFGRVSRSSGAGLAVWLGLAAVLILLDQFTKVLIVGNFQYGEVHTVTAFFDVVRAHNTGAAFSFLAGAAGWQRWFFIGLGGLASAVIVWMLRQHAGQTLFCFAISMILGGAVGNVIDRLVHGYVVDFLQFHWGFLSPMFSGGYFPAFNVADSAITAGAIGLILDELRRVRRG